MAQLFVEVPDAHLPQFMAYLHAQGYPSAPAQDEMPDEATQAMVMQRIAQNTDADYTSWEQVRERVFGRFRNAA